jgi:hypothetical protein
MYKVHFGPTYYHNKVIKVWMCGGSIEILPCSHVGHIYRSGHPYNMTGRGGNLDVHGTNSKRLAEVWMDDYKRLFYVHRMGLKVKIKNTQKIYYLFRNSSNINKPIHQIYFN